MYRKAPPAPVAAAWNWGGFYIGGNVGGSRNDTGFTYDVGLPPPLAFASCGTPPGGVFPVPVGPNPFDLSNDCSRSSSVIGGAQIGYNWQAGTWVFGLEADGAWQSLIQHTFVAFGSNPAAGSPFGTIINDTAYFRTEQTALGTFRGRIGYSPGNWLIYATGGLVVGAVKHSATEVLAPGVACPVAPDPRNCRTGSDDKTKVGWTVGAGAEWMIAENWSIGAEYLYVDLGSSTITLEPIGGFFPNTSSIQFDDREHIARLKINYHFGGPAVASIH